MPDKPLNYGIILLTGVTVWPRQQYNRGLIVQIE